MVPVLWTWQYSHGQNIIFLSICTAGHLQHYILGEKKSLQPIRAGMKEEGKRMLNQKRKMLGEKSTFKFFLLPFLQEHSGHNNGGIW